MRGARWWCALGLASLVGFAAVANGEEAPVARDAPAGDRPPGFLRAQFGPLRDVGKSLQGFLSGLALGDTCPRIAEWSRQVEREYPGVDLSRMPSNQLALAVIRLYGDESFVPVFGKPYDQMSEQERLAILQHTLQKCFNEAAYRDSFAAWQRVTLGRPFTPRLVEFGPVQVAPYVATLRQARSDVTKAQEQIARLPNEAGSYERLKELQASVAKSLPYLWPSEQAAFGQAAASTRTRVAAAGLAGKLDPLLASADGYEGALALRRAIAEQRELLGAVEPATRQRYEQEVNARVGKIVATLMDGERAAIGQLGSGPAALERGAGWYREFQGRYGQFGGDEQVIAVGRAFLEERRRQIATAGPELRALVEQGSSPSEIDGLLVRYLSLPGDRADPGAAPVIAAAGLRKQVLQRQSLIASSGSTDPVVACDTFAGHPDDPQKGAARGVPDDQLDALKAIEACSDALDARPTLVRLRFQLARGLWKAELFEEAIDELLDAGLQGHGGALAYLGDAALFGVAGLDPNPELAKSLYQRAAKAGFRPAAALAAEIVPGVKVAR